MSESQPPVAPLRFTARALLLGDRIDLNGLERADAISASPLAFHVGQSGKVALYRYGVAVLAGLTPLEEEDVLARLRDRVVGSPLRKEDEAVILLVGEAEDRVAPNGAIAKSASGSASATWIRARWRVSGARSSCEALATK